MYELREKKMNCILELINCALCSLCNLCVLRAPKKGAQRTVRLHKGHNGYSWDAFSVTTTRSFNSTCIGSRPILTTARFPRISSTSPTW